VSRRLLKINQVIRQELSQILLRECEFNSALVSITQVETSPDLSRAKVKISVLPEKMTSEVLKKLNRQIFFLQKKLDKKLAFRPVPKISFVIDKSILEGSRVEELVQKIH